MECGVAGNTGRSLQSLWEEGWKGSWRQQPGALLVRMWDLRARELPGHRKRCLPDPRMALSRGLEAHSCAEAEGRVWTEV